MEVAGVYGRILRRRAGEFAIALALAAAGAFAALGGLAFASYGFYKYLEPGLGPSAAALVVSLAAFAAAAVLLWAARILTR